MRSRRLPIYDREIEIAQLHIDERSGAEHHLIRYPEGLRAQPHTHAAAHTMVVLEGVLNANGQELGPFAYCHFPAGEVMTHQPAKVSRACSSSSSTARSTSTPPTNN